MKRLFSLVALLLLCSATAAFALTDEEYRDFIEESPVFAAAEKEMNSVWKQLKAALPQEEYKKLLVEQRAWLQQRDKTVEQMGKDQARAQETGEVGVNIWPSQMYGLVTEQRVGVLKAKLAKVKR